MSRERSRYWRCTVTGHPHPEFAPLPLTTFVYLAWTHTETKLDLFVVYKENRCFPVRYLKEWSPLPRKCTLSEYLEDPLPPDSLCYGVLPKLKRLHKPKMKILKNRKPRKPREARSNNPLVFSSTNIHYDCLTGVTTELDPAYGSVPSANVSKNLE